MPDSKFISEFARVFVENARAAAEQRFKIPEWVFDRLPMRKVVLPALGMMIYTMYGIKFVIPIGVIVGAMLESIGVMRVAILAEMNVGGDKLGGMINLP